MYGHLLRNGLVIIKKKFGEHGVNHKVGEPFNLILSLDTRTTICIDAALKRLCNSVVLLVVNT